MRTRSSRRADADEHFVDYILGRLSEEEVDRLDKQSILDEAIADRLRNVEDDLVDAYVRGSLDGDSLRRFESRYLATARGRDKVRFARAFVGAVDRAGQRDTSAAASSGFRGVWKLAAVTAVLLVCGGVVLQILRVNRPLRVSMAKHKAREDCAPNR